MKTLYGRCVVCGRIIEDSSRIPFCDFHTKAYSSLLAGYVEWRKAYGDLPPAEFLRMLKDNEYSGRWVKEVAKLILSREDLMQVFLNDLSSQGMRD